MTTLTTRPSRGERAPLAVVRADREVHKDLDDANEADVLPSPSLPGPDVEWVHADLDVSKPPQGDDLGEPHDELQGRFERRRHRRGERTRSHDRRDLAAIRERWMAGELYEPRDDHLRVT